MASAMNPLWEFKAPARFTNVSKSSAGCNQHVSWLRSSNQKVNSIEAPSVLFLGPRRYVKDVRWSSITLATDSNQPVAEPNTTGLGNGETAVTNEERSSSDVQLNVNGRAETSPGEQELKAKRSPLTAREKLRAARVLSSRYTESKAPKREFGSRVLDALRESDKGKRRSGLPEAPTNLFDDSKRGLPKQGLTFDIPGGSDLLVILASFVLISTLMFATTYVVWKSGAIHFNES